MRKLTSILAALASVTLATLSPVTAQTVPMVVTVNGNGTLTGSGITGSVVPHGTTATMTLNVPALTSAAITSTFTGTCSSSTALLGNGACGPAGVSSITLAAPTGFGVTGSPCSNASSCAFTLTTTLNGVIVGNGSGFGVASGTCNSTTFVTGAGSCSAVSSSQTIGGFTGTCSNSTYLAGSNCTLVKVG